ncbi:fatty acyl-CoA reductase 2 isoform X1 [Sarcophilus harrisii]|uniref:Fatty acyl-CoA reductase n=1 Tax=Sarcophilus harrisii TaxID=9305 RepID=G3VTL0_SARHA|nr:fatty acyl-CoA reductase 2 isoform X1 [Sarcophilus harrisii]XP_031793965.1 fatty acyl-CoA reductase 2 isoform X1 [Sarcophilus harrisii]
MSVIAAFYGGKSILITGATGFMGKVLMEKLLRTSPDLKVIYILVRPKAGQSLQQRVSQMMNCKLFEKAKEICPNIFEKIRPIYSDLTKPDLGISKEDLEELLTHTNIIFHCAATVRFDDPLRHALQLNVIATQQLLFMASQMLKLEVFIHFSTAYSNCNLKHIDEVIYPCSVEPKKLIDSVEWLDDSIIEEITPKLIENRPNTYTYTKALGEMVVYQERGNLNIAIIRPSIVGASWQEPFPGWVDNLNGPNGLIIAAGKGFLHSLKATPKAVADVVPVDLVINLTLAVGWHTAVHRPKSILIYHCTSGSLNPCLWTDLGFQVLATFEKAPLEKAFRRPNADFTTNNFSTYLWNTISHMAPAVMYDFYLRLTGRKPRMAKLMNRMLKTISMLDYFINRSWEWSSRNTEMLMSQLSNEDQKLFDFDVRHLNWLEYTENYCLGIKKYLLKEDMAGIPAAKRHLRMLRNIHYLFNTVLFLIIWRFFIARSQMARNVWYFVVSLCYKFLSYFRASSTFRH